MEQANWPSWLRDKLPVKPFSLASFEPNSLAVFSALGLALTVVTWFGPIWVSQMAMWLCLFLTLEAFAGLLHKTPLKTTWLFALITTLVLPAWVTIAITYGTAGHTAINVLLLIGNISAVMGFASATRKSLSDMVMSTAPVLIMSLAIAIAVIVEGPNPQSLVTIKWLHLVCLLLIGLTALDATAETKTLGPVSLFMMTILTVYWLANFTQVLPTATYLVEQLSWETSSGRVITVVWLTILMITVAAHKDSEKLVEFPTHTKASSATSSSVGSVELAIWVLPLMAILGLFNLSATSFRVLAIAAIISATLFIRRFRVLQVREMETSDRLHVALATDPLTGALNRTGLAQHWDENHSGATVAFIDLDQFKPINDRHGHIVGDEVLQILSKRIMNSIRAQDVVCRWGGDEFLIVGPSMDPQHADAFCDRIRDAIQVPMSIKGGLVLKMDASIGYALVGAGVDFVTATEQADRMMYLKKHGKQRTSKKPRPVISMQGGK